MLGSLHLIMECGVVWLFWSYNTGFVTILLYFTVLYRNVLYYTGLYCTVLYCYVLYCTGLYCTALSCPVLFYNGMNITVL